MSKETIDVMVKRVLDALIDEQIAAVEPVVNGLATAVERSKEEGTARTERIATLTKVLNDKLPGNSKLALLAAVAIEGPA